MAFDFPSSPTNGQQYTPVGGPTYTFNDGKWALTTGTTLAAQVPFTPVGDIAATNVQAAIAELAAEPKQGFRNLLINPDGRICQRYALPIGGMVDDTYVHDRWNLLVQTAATTLNTVADAENGTPYMWRIQQAQAVAQRVGYEQIIEGSTSRAMRGKAVTLSGRVRSSAAINLCYAIVPWIGIEDTVTSDIVLDWTSSTYTSGNFFVASGLSSTLVTGVVTLTANALMDLPPLTLPLVFSSVTNLIVFLWTESAVAQGTTFEAAVQLEEGTVATPREFRPIAVELAMCQRYFERWTAGISYMFGFGYNASATQHRAQLNFVPKRVTPTTATGTAASDFNVAGVACTSVVVSSHGPSRGIFQGDVASGLTVGQGSYIRSSNANAYLAIDAEL